MKLNLGCGDKILEGYVNVDVAESRAGRRPDVLCDLHALTSFETDSVDEILSVHVIEHFWRWEVVDVLREWLRTLKPGGRMVLECPNLQSACETFLANPDLRSGPGQEGQRSMWVFYGDPVWRDPLMVHRWGYTPASLAQVMREAGLVSVHQEPAQFKLREPRDMRIVGEKPRSGEREAGLTRPGTVAEPVAAPVPRDAASALISESYREMQRKLHENPDYGTASVEYAPLIADLVKTVRATELLDYGAGKGRLASTLRDKFGLNLRVHHYDPAIPEWSAPPAPCRLVTCIDVLEHVEPDLIDNVLDDLKRVTLAVGLFTVHTGPAYKVLADGRNAHLIQQPTSWWLPKILQRFELVLFNRVHQGFYVGVEAKDS